MSAIINIIAACCSCFSPNVESENAPYFEKSIHNDSFTFSLVSTPVDKGFSDICDMYQIGQEDLNNQLVDMVLWCVYDAKNCPIGAIQLDKYDSVVAIKSQVHDQTLAQYLYKKGKTYELSYALTEENRGKGLGSKVVSAWLHHAKSAGYSTFLFAVVDDKNVSSINNLEKNEFMGIGTYKHGKDQTLIRVYILQ